MQWSEDNLISDDECDRIVTAHTNLMNDVRAIHSNTDWVSGQYDDRRNKNIERLERLLAAQAISDEEDTSVAKPLFATSKWAKAGAASKAAVRLRVS